MIAWQGFATIDLVFHPVVFRTNVFQRNGCGIDDRLSLAFEVFEGQFLRHAETGFGRRWIGQPIAISLEERTQCRFVRVVDFLNEIGDGDRHSLDGGLFIEPFVIRPTLGRRFPSQARGEQLLHPKRQEFGFQEPEQLADAHLHFGQNPLDLFGGDLLTRGNLGKKLINRGWGDNHAHFLGPLGEQPGLNHRLRGGVLKCSGYKLDLLIIPARLRHLLGYSLQKPHQGLSILLHDADLVPRQTAVVVGGHDNRIG